MLFTSYSFLGFFAFILVTYYWIPKKFQWILLLGASYFFYFMAGAGYLAYILSITIATYFTALTLERNIKKQQEYLKEHKQEMAKEERKIYKACQKKVRFRWFLTCLLVNIGILAVVKYSNFVIFNFNEILKVLKVGQAKGLSFLTIALPMGISFYTFQAVGYLIDVYRGTIFPEKNFGKFALFISFFPQLVQGPISRYGDLSKSLYNGHAFDGKTISYGLQRILWGYFKKLVIADRILVGTATIIGDVQSYQGAYAFVGMVFYTLELYADFTGGIDITIGIAETLGITVQENFCRPYFSKSLKEYWRRWHISMCSWFRDYIFYPVSISRPMRKISSFSRKYFGRTVGGRVPVYLSSFVVWLATGIWHGASWNFVVWGLGNWIILMISEELEPFYSAFRKKFLLDGKEHATKQRFFVKMGIYKLFQVIRTFLLVCCLNMFDCYENVTRTLQMFASMFQVRNWEILWNGSLMKIGLSISDYCVLVVGITLLTGISLWQRSGSVREKIAGLAYPVRFLIWYGLLVAVLIMGNYGIGYDASQFIYNRF